MTAQLEPSAARVGGSTAIQWATRGVGMALSLISLVVVARHLGTAEYGRLTVVVSYFSFVAVLADWGFPATLLRELSRGDEVDPRLVGSVVLGRLAVSVAVYAVALGMFVVLVGQGRRTIDAAALMLVAVVPSSVASTVTPVLQASLRLHVAAALELVARVLGFVATIAVVLHGGGVVGVLAVQVGVYLVNVLLLLPVVSRATRLVWQFDAATFRRVVRASAPLGLAMLLNAVYYRVDAVMLAALGGLAEAGRYGAAYRVMDSALTLPSVLASVLFPLFVRRSGDWVVFRRLVRNCLAAAQLVMLPLAVAGIAFSSQVMRLVGGHGFEAGANALRLLLFAGLVSALDIVLGLALIAIDRNRQALWLNVVALALNVVLNLVAIPRWGASGAAAATLASESVVAVCALVLLDRWTGGPVVGGRALVQLGPACAGFAVFLLARLATPSLAQGLLTALAFLAVLMVTRNVSWRAVTAAVVEPRLAVQRAVGALR